MEAELSGGLRPDTDAGSYEQQTRHCILVKVQYRMNDDICVFSSEWFYQGELKSTPEVKYRSILDYAHTDRMDKYGRNGMQQKSLWVKASDRINEEEAALPFPNSPTISIK